MKRLALLLACVAFLACAPDGADVATPTAAPPPTPAPNLTLDALKNAEYVNPLDPQAQVRLSNGTYVQPPPPGQASTLQITLMDDTIAFGDLNADSQEDAALVLSSSAGGSGTFRTLVAVINQGGLPVQAASASLGDRVRINSIAVQTGTIVADMVTHGPQDPLCCPTVQKLVRYRLVGGQLATE